jgi:hypothetical protein
MPVNVHPDIVEFQFGYGDIAFCTQDIPNYPNLIEDKYERRKILYVGNKTEKQEDFVPIIMLSFPEDDSSLKIFLEALNSMKKEEVKT